jgi:D-galactarolactone isomerase
MLQNRIGTTRVVIVTPRNYRVDNSATVDAIAQLGADARVVAVLYPAVTDAELKKLHDGEIRGFASASAIRR